MNNVWILMQIEMVKACAWLYLPCAGIAFGSSMAAYKWAINEHKSKTPQPVLVTAVFTYGVISLIPFFNTVLAFYIIAKGWFKHCKQT